ncbi:hypothetical protein [Rhizobium wuzhouense]|uniref:Uncharacterized protein n=1 Tax=Rhizobium wuzhouense TaxID=1986026 RepID=A0ABX5NN80_9HYPH|nr:hypothetical protein [Rhizobium wuzhouense]PYB71289.1 hypothetical protein DMY87_18195 [Rhizobium wuzhouense]
MSVHPVDLIANLEPARVIERAALPVVRGVELMAMADIEKATLNKRDWRRLTGIQGRDFGGIIVFARKGARG